MAADDMTPRLALPLLQGGQLQKHLSLNQALSRLDLWCQAVAEAADLTRPPHVVETGQVFLLGTPAADSVWAGFQSGDVVVRTDDDWEAITPPEGVRVYVRNEAQIRIFQAGQWVPMGRTLRVLGPVERLGVGTDPSEANVVSVKGPSVLLSARAPDEGGTGDCRLSLNKSSAQRTGSLIFQSAWSGRAEIGLMGQDDPALKVGADDGQWREVWRADRQTGSLWVGAIRGLSAATQADAPVTLAQMQAALAALKAELKP